MRLKALIVLFFSLSLSACEKDREPKDCIVQYLVATSPGSSTAISTTYTYDSNNRLVQLRQTDSPETPDGNVKTTTYIYDSEGRIAELVHRSKFMGEMLHIDGFEYNSQGQVVAKVMYFKDGENPKTETGRVEYTYASAKELHTTKWYVADGLLQTQEFLYTDGVMTGMKATTRDGQYEVEIKYDDKKNPYSGSPALQAIKLDYGYPHQHNIVSLSGKTSGGSGFSQSMNYTYSGDGYPLTVQETVSGRGVVSNVKYSYSCF